MSDLIAAQVQRRQYYALKIPLCQGECRRLSLESGHERLSLPLSRADVTISRAVSGKRDVFDCAPHFEKVLYDNAQLTRVYLHAWQVTCNEFFRTITEKILDYVVREMTYVGADANDQQFRRTPKLPSNATDEVGGVAFYSTQDADSEGEEGKFFVWTLDEIREVLGEDAKEFIAAYGVTRHGNFEGKNILEFVGDMDQRPALAEARCKLFEAREKRVHPGRDDVQLALAPTAKQCRRLHQRHCQGADLVERPDAGCVCRGSARLLPLARDWERAARGEGRNLPPGGRTQR